MQHRRKSSEAQPKAIVTGASRGGEDGIGGEVSKAEIVPPGVGDMQSGFPKCLFHSSDNEVRQ